PEEPSDGAEPVGHRPASPSRVTQVRATLAVEEVLKTGGKAGDPYHATGDETLVLLAIQEDKPVGVIDVVGVRLVGLPVDTWRATFGHLLVIDPEVFPQLGQGAA